MRASSVLLLLAVVHPPVLLQVLLLRARVPSVTHQRAAFALRSFLFFRARVLSVILPPTSSVHHSFPPVNKTSGKTASMDLLTRETVSNPSFLLLLLSPLPIRAIFLLRSHGVILLLHLFNSAFVNSDLLLLETLHALQLLLVRVGAISTMDTAGCHPKVGRNGVVGIRRQEVRIPRATNRGRPQAAG